MIDILTAAEATERLRAEGFRISPETVRDGILQKQFPWGSVIVDDAGRVKKCYIYAAELEKWLAQKRSVCG